MKKENKNHKFKKTVLRTQSWMEVTRKTILFFNGYKDYSDIWHLNYFKNKPGFVMKKSTYSENKFVKTCFGCIK